MDEDSFQTDQPCRSTSSGAKTAKSDSKRRRLASETSIVSSGSAYSAMTTPPSSVAIPETFENYRTKGRLNEIKRDNSIQRIEETKLIVSEVEWVRIDRCKESNILRKSVAHHATTIEWIVSTRPPPQSMLLTGFKDASGNVAVLDGNARLIGMRKANSISMAVDSCNAYDEVCVRLVKSDNVMDGALSILKSQKFTDYTLTEKLGHLRLTFEVLSIDRNKNYQEICKMLKQILSEEVYSVRIIRLSLCPDNIMTECCSLLENKELSFTVLERFHAAFAVNSVEAEEAFRGFIRDKDPNSFDSECRHIASSVGSYLRSLVCGYDLIESRFIEESVKAIPPALNYLRSSLRAQRWKKKKSTESVVKSIEELWSKETTNAREKRGISVEIADIGDLSHDIYILPMKVVPDRTNKRRNSSPILSIQDAEAVTNGIIIFVDGEDGEAVTYCGEEILLITRDVHPKGCLKRNFISCRIIIRRNSITLNKKDTVQFLDNRGFKTVTTYEAFAAAFNSFTVYMGACSPSSLEFIGTYYRLLKRVTVPDEDDKNAVETELKALNWTIK